MNMNMNTQNNNIPYPTSLNTEMDAQQIFNYVTYRIWKQARRSIKAGGEKFTYICAYRGDDGAMCAVGHMIPDQLYDPKMEGPDLGTLLRANKLSPATNQWLLFLKRHKHLLTDLQEAHDFMYPECDRPDFQSKWLDLCQRVAKNHGLEYYPELYTKEPK
jgi:hypothetical protein